MLALLDAVWLVVNLAEALVCTGLGLRWVFSPSFRAEVREKNPDDVVWYTICSLIGILLLLALLVFCAWQLLSLLWFVPAKTIGT